MKSWLQVGLVVVVVVVAVVVEEGRGGRGVLFGIGAAEEDEEEVARSPCIPAAHARNQNKNLATVYQVATSHECHDVSNRNLNPYKYAVDPKTTTHKPQGRKP